MRVQKAERMQTWTERTAGDEQKVTARQRTVRQYDCANGTSERLNFFQKILIYVLTNPDSSGIVNYAFGNNN